MPLSKSEKVGSPHPELYLSPSEYHHYLLNQTAPTLTFDGGEVGLWQAKLKDRVMRLLRLPEGERVPLNPRSLWKRDHPLGSIEKVAFASEPYADVLAYVCIPHKAQKPYPFFVCLQGHSTGAHVSIAVDRDDNTKLISGAAERKMRDQDLDYGLGCMSRGIAALCIEQRSFGERRERQQEKTSPHGCHDAVMHSLLLGRTLVGERVFDVDRGLDYLETRDDVDWSRIGIVGASGGGTASLFSAAVLDRINFAMPAAYFCTSRDSVMSIYHCADNYVPGLLKYADMADIMGLFAPKPVVVVAGQDDPIFPIDGTMKEFRRLKKIFAAAGAEDRCHLVIGEGGHRFYASLAWQIMLQELENVP